MPRRRVTWREAESQNESVPFRRSLRSRRSLGQSVKDKADPSTGKAANVSPDSQVEMSDTIHEDDICPICQLLLYAPVVTQCNHTLCRTCMATWADVSLSQPMAVVPLDEQAVDFDAVSGIDARCPMCRTQTSAVADLARAQDLIAKYPQAYAIRGDEEREDEAMNDSVQPITICLGNTHALMGPVEETPSNIHLWTFFVRPSRTDIIEEVQIFLHGSFRPSRVIRQRPPYEISRKGWGYFRIMTWIILKAGYSWMSSDAEDSPDGAPKGLLRLEWELNFNSFGGEGAMGRCRLKVKNDRNWEDVEDENERDAAEWNRVVRQYQEDGNYVPPPEE